MNLLFINCNKNYNKLMRNLVQNFLLIANNFEMNNNKENVLSLFKIILSYWIKTLDQIKYLGEYIR